MGEQQPDQFLGWFGEAVRARREALNISQEELAARCKLHRTYVAGVERGIRNPSLKSIRKLAEGLGLPLSALFARMGPATKPGRGAKSARKG
jgi:transcriptional regulator with XRE-family HTH domain